MRCVGISTAKIDSRCSGPSRGRSRMHHREVDHRCIMYDAYSRDADVSSRQYKTPTASGTQRSRHRVKMVATALDLNMYVEIVFSSRTRKATRRRRRSQRTVMIAKTSQIKRTIHNCKDTVVVVLFTSNFPSNAKLSMLYTNTTLYTAVRRPKRGTSQKKSLRCLGTISIRLRLIPLLTIFWLYQQLTCTGIRNHFYSTGNEQSIDNWQTRAEGKA